MLDDNIQDGSSIEFIQHICTMYSYFIDTHRLLD